MNFIEKIQELIIPDGALKEFHMEYRYERHYGEHVFGHIEIYADHVFYKVMTAQMGGLMNIYLETVKKRITNVVIDSISISSSSEVTTYRIAKFSFRVYGLEHYDPMLENFK